MLVNTHKCRKFEVLDELSLVPPAINSHFLSEISSRKPAKKENSTLRPQVNSWTVPIGRARIGWTKCQLKFVRSALTRG